MCWKWHDSGMFFGCTLRAVGAGVPSSGLNGDSLRRGLIDVPSVGCYTNLSRVYARQWSKTA